MSKLNFKELSELLESRSDTNLRLIFVTRHLKDGVKSRDRMLQKYDFDAYHIDVDSEIRKHLFSLFKREIKKYQEKNLEFADYQVIADDIEQIVTYSMENKTLSFKDLVERQLTEELPKVKALADILATDELWAYCLELDLGDQVIYGFRKMLKGKVGIGESDNKKSMMANLRTSFSTKDEQLELIEGETIFLEQRLDCIYYTDKFYVFKKTQFEQILGLDAEFKAEADTVVASLEELDMIEGLGVISELIKSKPAIHKKMTRIKSLGNYKSLTKDVIKEMKAVGAEFDYQVKVNEDGQLHIEDESDVDLVIRLLCDFYKEGRIFKKKYGTFSGTVISTDV